MGFYGNSLNSSALNNQFQFDKIFPNSYVMNLGQDRDNVFIGRTVLIRYENPLELLPEIFFNGEKEVWCLKDNPNVVITEKNFNCGWLSDGSSGILFYSYHKNENQEYVFGEDSVLNDAWDKWSNDYYTFNSKIDRSFGHEGDLDSTVWQKTYLNNIETYLRIAKLNAEAPSIALEILIPDQEGNPTKPTLKVENSLNYTLGIAPTYGIEAGNFYYGEEYFDKDKVPESSTDISKKENKIIFELTGKSEENLEYNDTYVLDINLPIFGQIAKEGWDLLYGESRDITGEGKNSTGLAALYYQYRNALENLQEDDTLNALIKDVEALKDQADGLDQDVGNLNLQMDQNDQKLQNQIISLDEEIKIIDGEVQEITNSINQLKEIDIEIIEKANKNSDEISILKEKNESLETEINTLSAENQSLIERIKYIENFLAAGHFLFSWGRDSQYKNFDPPTVVEGQNQEIEQN